MPLGSEIGIGPGHIVLDGAQLPPPKKKRGHIPNQKTKRLAPWGGTTAAMSPIFLVRVCTVAPHLYTRFHSDRFRFGKL